MTLPYSLPYSVDLRREQRASDSRVQRPTPRVLADRERTRRCRSALLVGWRWPSFWRVVRRPVGCARCRFEDGRRRPPLRLPNADLCPLGPGLAVSVVA
jgi:hypothetical protein